MKVQELKLDFMSITEIRDEESIILDDEDVLKNAYGIIIERIDGNKCGLFFIDGVGGTGKTFLYRALLAMVRSNGMIALATATLGVAASILPGGQIAHSRFQIP